MSTGIELGINKFIIVINILKVKYSEILESLQNLLKQNNFLTVIITFRLKD